MEELLKIFLQQQSEARKEQLEARKEQLEAHKELVMLLSNQSSSKANFQTEINKTTNFPFIDVPLFELDDQDDNVFDEWLKRFEYVMDYAAPEMDSTKKVKCILTKFSTEAFSEYNKWCMPKEPTDFNYEETKNNLQKLFGKKQTLFIDRFNCMRIRRSPDEDYSKYVNRAKAMLKKFKFSELTEDQFNTLIVLTGLTRPEDESIRTRILQKLNVGGADVKFDEVVNDFLTIVATKSEQHVFEDRRFNLNSVSKENSRHNHQKFRSKSSSRHHSSSSRTPPGPCFRCGELHWIKDCEYSKYKCTKCFKIGHLEAQCGKHLQRKTKAKKIGSLQFPIQINSLQSSNLIKGEVIVNKIPVTFYLDTGAEINIIDENTYEAIGSPNLIQCREKGLLFDGTSASLIGKGSAVFEINGKRAEQTFYVAKRGSLNLLGVGTLDYFNFLDELRTHFRQSFSINQCSTTVHEEVILSLKEEFPDVFTDELGLCTKTKASLQLKPDAKPIYRRARPVPYASREVVDKELDRLEEMGVIKKIEHTNWAAPILVVTKANGKARVCVDYSTGLNDALQPHQHPLPLPEDIFATLNGGQIFSQLDLSDAYLQVD